jgi:hypothetical protein
MRKGSSRLITLLLLVMAMLLVPAAGVIAQEPQVEFAFGLLPSPEGNYPTVMSASSLTALPENVDLSAMLPPVINQGRQSSCVGFTLAYYLRTYQEAVENNRVPHEDRHIFSPAFIYNQRNGGCSRDVGMTFWDGLTIIQNKGTATLATMPYEPNDSCSQPSAEASAEALTYRIEGYQAVFVGKGRADLASMKNQLAQGQPVALAVPIYSEFFRVSYGRPVIDLPQPGSTFYGGHAILVVGYDEARRTFKVVNSWGTYWAEGGFGYLTYDFVRQEAWEAWIILDKDTTPPEFDGEAYELGGVVSGRLQSQITSPVFAWDASPETGVVYDIYWGRDAQGRQGVRSAQAFFQPEPVALPGAYYLRVRALDAAGNATAWRTLFVFQYVPAESGLGVLERTPGLTLARTR